MNNFIGSDYLFHYKLFIKHYVHKYIPNLLYLSIIIFTVYLIKLLIKTVLHTLQRFSANVLMPNP